MKQRYCIILVVLLIIPWLAPVGAGIRAQTVQDDAESWVRENYRATLELAFHDQGCPTLGESRSVRWVVCLRIIPGHPNEIEYGLALERHYDRSVVARTVRPRGQSIFLQLTGLKKEHPDGSPGALAPLLALESQRCDERKVAELRKLADQFEKLRVAPVLSDELMVDATRYEVLSRASYGEQMELVLFGPGAAARRQPSPFLQWAEALRQLLAGAFQ